MWLLNREVWLGRWGDWWKVKFKLLHELCKVLCDVLLVVFPASPPPASPLPPCPSVRVNWEEFPQTRHVLLELLSILLLGILLLSLLTGVLTPSSLRLSLQIISSTKPPLSLVCRCHKSDLRPETVYRVSRNMLSALYIYIWAHLTLPNNSMRRALLLCPLWKKGNSFRKVKGYTARKQWVEIRIHSNLIP